MDDNLEGVKSSSKIKDIFIELNGYKYFHSSSSMHNKDNRLIGRDEESKELVRILKNSDTHSGTYLVTGFRGIGKTSLVNNVLRDLSGSNIPLSLGRYLRVLVLCFLLLPLTKTVLVLCIYWIGLGLSLSYYFQTELIERRIIPSSTRVAEIFKLIKELINIFILRPSRTSDSGLFILANELILIFTLCGIFSLIGFGNLGSLAQTTAHFLVYYIAFVVIIILTHFFINRLNPPTSIRVYFKWLIGSVILIRVMTLLSRLPAPLILEGSKDVSNWDFLLSCGGMMVYWLVAVIFSPLADKEVISFRSKIRIFSIKTAKLLAKAVTKWFNGGNLEVIHVNLGKDDINEKDVLKQVAQTLTIRYKRSVSFTRARPQRVLWAVCLIVLFLIFQFPFYSNGLYSNINRFRYHTNLVQYLPSQALFPLFDKPNQIFVYEKLLSEDIGTQDSCSLGGAINLISPRLGEYLSFQKVDAMFFDNPNLDIDQYIRQINLLMYDSLEYNRNDITEVFKFGNEEIFKRYTQYADFFVFMGYGKFRRFVETFIISLSNPNVVGRVRMNEILNKRFFGFSYDFRILPATVDYFQIFNLLFFVGILKLIGKYRLLGFITHGYILKRLKHLDERIDSYVVRGTNSGTSVNKSFLGFNFARSNKNSYPLADFAVIETELIQIFQEISQIPFFLYKPRFVFIFDELDKIEPHSNANIEEKEAGMTDFGQERQDTSGHTSAESQRNRQQVISRLLANLKHFFNTVDAKFIFIAGREMYDGSLADTSDREAFIGSIFNNVIYVPSFYTDDSDGKPTDITSMTESFVCQFLGGCEGNEYDSLKNFYATLKRSLEIRLTQDGKHYFLNKVEGEKDLKNKVYVKTLYTLQNFIIYLTYRSNGSPKKITQLFEKYVKDSLDPQIDKDSLVIGERMNRIKSKVRWFKQPQGFYLKFSETDQYRFAFTSQLFTPLITSQGKYIKNLGDKLLVSTSFLMDHLYKYHQSAFSWQNLELTPEIIAVNKAPQLREFIKSIVDHLTKSHLRPIISGLHEFKFQSKIRGEISYISKISELEAAAFNFTLDESIQLKRHYQKKLNQERKVVISYDKDPDMQFIHGIGFYNELVGDLYFYDQEYDEALKYYKNGVQELRYIIERDKAHKYVYLLALYLRSLMKVGLTYEKQNNNDLSLLTYGKITNEIVKNRDFDLRGVYDLEDIRLTYQDINDFINKIDPFLIFQCFSDDVSNDGFYEKSKYHLDLLERGKSKIETVLKEYLDDNLSFKTSPLLKNIGSVEYQKRVFKEAYDHNYSDQKINYSRLLAEYLLRCLFENKSTITVVVNSLKRSFLKDSNGNENYTFFAFPENLYKAIKRSYNFDPKQNEYNYIKNFYENLRLAYQPIVARLSLLEKAGLNGVTYSDVEESDKQVYFLLKSVNDSERTILLAEYLNKVGDILYYKNGMVVGTSYTSVAINQNDRHEGTKIVTPAQINEIHLGKSLLGDPKYRYYKAPYSAYEYYLRSLYSIWMGYTFEEKRNHHEIYVKNTLIGRRKQIRHIIYGSTSPNESNIGTNSKDQIIELEREILESLFKIIIDGVGNSKLTTAKDEVLNSFANVLTDLGDATFSMASLDSKISISLLNELNLKCESFNSGNDLLVNIDDKSNINKILNYALNDKKNKLNKAIVYYYLAYLFFEKNGRYRNASMQLTKIIYLAADYRKLGNFIGSNKRIFFEAIDKIFFRKAIYLIHRSFDNTIRPEKRRYSFVTGIPYFNRWNDESISEWNKKESNDIDDADLFMDRKYLKHSSINAYLKDLYILMTKLSVVLDIDLNLYDESSGQIIKSYSELSLRKFKNQIIHPLVTNSSNFTRVFEQLLACRINLKIMVKSNLVLKVQASKHENIYYYKSLFEIYEEFSKKHKVELKKLPEQPSDNAYTNPLIKRLQYLSRKENLTEGEKNVNELFEGYDLDIKVLKKFERVALDSIYCLNSLLENIHLFGPSFLVYHTVIAAGHKRLGDWLRWFKNYLRFTEFLDDSQKIRDEALRNLRELLNEKGGLYHIDASYQYDRAREHFYLALQTHNEGKEYQNMIRGLYYLEDDFNDDLMHFFVSRERYSINSGYLQQEIKEIGFHLKYSETNDLNVFHKDYIP